MITISFQTKDSEAFCPWCKSRIPAAIRQHERKCDTCGNYFRLRDEIDYQRAAEAENCSNCRCWFQMSETTGLCRRYPPREDEDTISGDWWCGEWRTKQP